MNIAVLGWGSLIWCPGQLRIRSMWHSDGPRLEIEFARISKDGRLTLVIHPGSAEQQTYWAMAEHEDLAGTIENLRDRERCKRSEIGVVKKSRAATEERIGDWLKQIADIDAVVWTNLRSNWVDKRRSGLSCVDALLYVNQLGRQKRERAEQYVRNAPSQVQTELRALLRNNLGWSDNELPRVLFI
jgi:hypothetical protein